MGGSIGMALRAAGFQGRTFGLAQDPSDIEAAISASAIDAGSTRVEDVPRPTDLICLCVPLSVMPAVLRFIGPLLDDPRTVVTDVGSVKAPIVDAAASIMAHPGNFVGGHPMAGFRQRGVNFARADLFHGVNVILTPVSATRPEALELVRDLWRTLDARLITMSPSRHDEVVARVSQLPHIAAVLLLLQAARDDGLSVAGTGLMDVTRVVARDVQLWQDILTCNREQIREALGQLIEDFRRLDLWLERREDESVKRTLARAAETRDEWVAQRFQHPDWID